jgi:hypothetical protein
VKTVWHGGMQQCLWVCRNFLWLGVRMLLAMPLGWCVLEGPESLGGSVAVDGVAVWAHYGAQAAFKMDSATCLGQWGDSNEVHAHEREKMDRACGFFGIPGRSSSAM